MIVARASTREAERKLVLAGADRVVQPYAAAGTEMAKLALKPQVAAFLELVSSHGGPDLRFEELEVTSASPQVGRTIREIRIRSTTGAVVIALRKPDGAFDVTPNPDETIDAGDVVIAIGTEEELRALEDLFGAGSVGS
jgi:voltage-gated potassium channel